MSHTAPSILPETREMLMKTRLEQAHSEANVEIARGAGRDSRHMRSIAIVTMVFLPGTFFAVSSGRWSRSHLVLRR